MGKFLVLTLNKEGRLVSILFIMLMIFSFFSFKTVEKSSFFTKTIHQFNLQIKQAVKKEILINDLPQRNYFVQDKVNQLKSVKPNFELPTFMPTTSCPDIDVIDLRNVAGFSQLDDLTVCGAADTLSFMIFTGDAGEIKGFELTLDLPDGIEYAGWEHTQLGNTAIAVTKPKENKPEFYIDGITGDSLVIVNIGIRSNCEVDKENDLFVDFNYEYTFIDTADVVHKCSGTFRPELEINSAIHEPVLNMLTPLSPVEATIGLLGSPFCQTIQISQDGLNAYLDSFTFEILNLDLSGDLLLDSATVNGIDYPLGNISFNASTNTTSFLIDGSYFPSNSFNSPTDNQMNTNEVVEVVICYQTNTCPENADLPFRYNAKFGCDDEICEDSGQNSFVLIRPTGTLMPTATAMLSIGGIEICGNPGQVSITLNNPNINTEQNVYTDLQIGFQTCDKPNLEVASVSIGGVTIPNTFYSWVGDDINVDLRTNTDETLGLIDYDSDGFFDDLPGGSSISAIVSIEVSCGLNSEECALIDCQDVQYYVEAKTNCGSTFKNFPVPDAFDLLYGPTAVSNPTETEIGTSGVFGYDFGTYSNTGSPLTTTDSSTLEVEFCYTFDKLNIQDCPSGATNFFKVDFSGAPRFMKDLQYTPNSASWSIDSGMTYTPILDIDVNLTKADDESASLVLNAGSDDMNVCYKYSITLDTCLCSPVGYFSGAQKVVSSCSDCIGGCEILKACRTTTFRADPNCTNCDCIVQHGIHNSERSNFGYTDKTATTKHTKESLIAAGGSIDLTRFMPGDTLTHYDYYVVKDEAALSNLGRWSFSWYLVDETEGGATTENLELSLDAHNASLDKFQFSKAGVTTRSDIDFAGLSNCTGDPEDVYGSIWNFFNHTPWDDSIPHIKTQNSSNDKQDNNSLSFYIWNYDNIVDCGGTNASLADGNCLDELFNTLNVEVGDTIHFQWSSPLIINPFRAAQKILGRDTTLKNEAKVRSTLTVYQYDPIAGSAAYCETYVGTICREFSPLFFDKAGEVDAVTRLTLDDCGGNVEHTFTVNDLPGEVGDPWFTHEYRPFMDITKVNGLIRAPLAYCANAQVDKLGVTYDVSVDSSQNLFCSPVTGYDENICGVNADQTTGSIFFNLTDQGIPSLGIGFDNCDTIKLSYDLCMICPQDITGISEYGLFYDWSYVNTPKERDGHDIANQYVCNIADAGQESNSICDEFGFVNPNNWFEALALDSLVNKTDRLSEVFILIDNRSPRDPVSINNLGANLLASDAPGISEEIQEITIHNTSTTLAATGVGASVTIPSAVKLVNVYTDAGGTLPLTKTLISDDGAYKIYAIILPTDTYLANEQNSFFVGTTLLFCPDPNDPAPKICVATFFGCAPEEVKAALGGSGGCDNSEVCYAYISGEVGLQTEWFDMADSTTLCTETIFNVRVKNVKELVLLNLIPSFDLPPGIEPISGSWEVSYPGGEVAPLNWQPIGSDPDIISGNTYSYSDDALWSTKINADGLQGVSTSNITLDSNKVAFRFRATTSCDEFLSGSKMRTETTATDPCSADIISSGSTESPGVIISTANPADFAQLLIVAKPKAINCMGINNIFGITAINTGGKSTSDSVLVCMTIPEQLSFTPSSVYFTSPAGFVPNEVTQTAIGTKNEICFNAPAIDSYGTFSFEFAAAMDDNAECGKIRLGTDIKSFVSMVTCSPGPPTACGVFVQNSLNSFVTVELKPPFIAEDLVVYTDCAADPANVSLYYEYTVNHDGPDAVNQNYTVNFYQDIDGDLTVNSNVDELIGSDAGTFSVTDGNSIQISGNADVPAGQSCPVLFEVVYTTACACDREEQYFDKIENRALIDYKDPITMCAGSCFDIDVCDFVTFNADSIPSSTGIAYNLTLDWQGANRYSLPSPGGPAANISYESMTNNDIEPSTNNALIAEGNHGNGYIEATFPYVVNVDEIFLGGGSVSGWSNVIHVYGGQELTLEYSLDGINWTTSANGPLIPRTAIITGTKIEPAIAAKYFRITSGLDPQNWATSEFRLEGNAIPFQSTPPITKSGSTVTICIPDGVGIDDPWQVDFNTGTGACTNTETLEIWRAGTPAFTIEGDTLACGSECVDMEVIIPNEANAGMTIAWTPAGLIDDPTAFDVTACNLTTDVTFEATITYNNSDCQEVIQFPVKHFPINSINVIADTIYCYNPLLPPTLTADTGWDLYTWYEVSSGFEILAFSSFSNIFIPTGGGDYIVKASRLGTLCPAVSGTIPVSTIICPIDLGDLPDPNIGTATDDYETTLSNNGPSHVLVDDLYLGVTVDAETDGQPDNDAFGDGVDEDGITIFPSLNIVPGNTIRLPLSITNGTGSTAYLEAWIDWNGNGEFDESTERVANMDDGTTNFPSVLPITVPMTANVGSLLGVRLRLSNTDGLTPYGPANSGEIEDYLLGINCAQIICVPVTIDIKKK